MLCRFRLRAEENAPDVHALPDTGTREGVSLQPLPDAPPPHRDRARALPHRATDQDLVPEQAHEVEERKQRGQADGTERRRRGQHGLGRGQGGPRVKRR